MGRSVSIFAAIVFVLLVIIGVMIGIRSCVPMEQPPVDEVTTPAPTETPEPPQTEPPKTEPPDDGRENGDGGDGGDDGKDDADDGKPPVECENPKAKPPKCELPDTGGGD